MLSRLVAVALLAGVVSPIVSNAESIAKIGPPKNPPPASFAGTQFVDSRGCVYMRAGYNGKVTWVPRLDNGKQVLCGYEPTVLSGATAVATAAPVPTAKPVKAREPAPVVVAAAPVAAPVAARPSTVIAIPRGLAIRPPKGYVSAWSDGRLNPLRGPRSATGDAQMARIWTDSVPMRLKPEQARAETQQTSLPRLSTSNAPRVNAVAGRFVQAGSFAAPGHARQAVARLQAAGLPVAVAAARSASGQRLQVVLAGPFGDGQATGAALEVVRSAGFRDAFARN